MLPSVMLLPQNVVSAGIYELSGAKRCFDEVAN